MTDPDILVDTSTWIEIFQDSPWGHKALVCIEKNSPVAVSVLTHYELQYRLSDFFEQTKNWFADGNSIEPCRSGPGRY